MLLAVVFALAAAMANAVNLLTQHKASIGAPRQVKGWRLALYLPRQPLWLLGVAAAVGSFVFQALALHNGPMSVVHRCWSPSWSSCWCCAGCGSTRTWPAPPGRRSASSA